MGALSELFWRMIRVLSSRFCVCEMVYLLGAGSYLFASLCLFSGCLCACSYLLEWDAGCRW